MTDSFFLPDTGTDYVFVEGLVASVRLGITEDEKSRPQVVKLSFKVPVDSRTAARTDDIEQTVDYHGLGCWLVETAEQSSCNLLETMAHRLAAGAKNKFNLPGIELTVRKPEVYSGETCSGITVRR